MEDFYKISLLVLIFLFILYYYYSTNEDKTNNSIYDSLYEDNTCSHDSTQDSQNQIETSNFNTYMPFNNNKIGGFYGETLDDTVELAAANLPKKNNMFNFQVKNFLPNNEEAAKLDWFDNVSAPVEIQNRMLLNPEKQIGIDTIGSSNKNRSLDIRGAVNVAKASISPFLESTYEQDKYFNGLGACAN